MNMQILISEIEEVVSELGEPDCKLVNPYQVKQHKDSDIKYLDKFLSGYTTENTFMISSDKILTLSNPTESLLNKYKEMVK